MGKKIKVDIAELNNYFTELQSIYESVEKAVEEANKIGGIDFYQQGQAKSAVGKLSELPGKYESLLAHYARIAAVINLAAEEMATADQEIASGFKRIET